MPCSATTPSFNTIILSASRIVLSRWAMVSTVRPFINRSRASMTSRSDSVSRAAVGSSRIRIGLLRMMARAIIRNNPILILDEPTAALDTESERLVIEALERLMKGRTVLTIAHRLSTIRDADKIIVLKDGVVAEQGTHDQLLALGGTYAELYSVQFDTTPAKAAP